MQGRSGSDPAGDGSYPSGHTAAGWGWALAFSQINPERSNELFMCGLAFGQSRVICNAHWELIGRRWVTNWKMSQFTD